MRVAVVGHVEWVEFARVERVPHPGEIVHSLETWEEPAGGGAVAAAQLGRLAGTCLFFTALGADELGRRSRAELVDRGLDVVDGKVTYDTSGTLPTISLKLSKVPDGTIDGTMNGAFGMKGDLEGNVTLALTIAGDLQATMADPNKIERKPGTTHITGTATSDYGVFDVDFTR